MEHIDQTLSRDYQAANIIMILLVMMTAIIWGTHAKRYLVPTGCDNFGYARQAQLFREHGLIGGLNTSIDEPQAKLLIMLSEQVFSSSQAWSEPIAPHCHHYNSRSRKIILQYPPGTGLLLSLFPEKVAISYLLITGTLLSAGTLLWLGIGRRLSALSVTAIVGAVVALFWTLSCDDAFSSPSIPTTLLLLPTVALCAALFPSRHLICTFLFGLLCGLLLDVRLPNAILIAGLAIQIFVAKALWRKANIYASRLPIALTAIGFFTGIIPLLLANKINAGGLLKSTYSNIDASSPIITTQQILDGLTYYFTSPFGGTVLMIGAAYILIGFLAYFNSSKRYVPSGTIAATCSLVLSLLFFVTHSIHTAYYMVPASIMPIFMVTVEIVSQGEKTPRRRCLLAFLPLVAWTAFRASTLTPYDMTMKIPTEMMSPSAVTWADITGGTVFYYSGLYTAKLSFANQFTQNALVDAARKSGHVQYFIIDSDQMQRACDHQASRYGVTYVRTVETLGPKQVWKIDPSLPGTYEKCELSH